MDFLTFKAEEKESTFGVKLLDYNILF